MSNEYPTKPATHSISVKEQNANIAKEALASLASLNEGQRGTRIVTAGMVKTIVKRSLESTKDQTYSLRRQRALAEVFQFSSAIRQDRPLTASASNADLLPIAHPQSRRSHKLDSKEVLTLKARWYADDPRVTNPLVAPLLASAFTAHPNSPEYGYSVARLSAMGTSEVPLEALVAAFLPGANKFFWMRQLRGRDGRFIKMGGAMRRFVRRAGKVFSLAGRMVSADPNSKKVTMELPNGKLVRFPAAEGESAKAILPSQQNSDGFSKNPVKTSASDPVIDEADLEVVDSPDGWGTDSSWEPSQDDKDYYGNKVDLGTMFVDENNNYEVLKFEKANFPAKNRFEMAQQKEAEENDVVAYGKGKDGELNPDLPVYFIRRKDGKDKDFAAVQSWGEVQNLVADDEVLYEKGEPSDPKRPEAIAELKTADLKAGDIADVEGLQGDIIPGDPNASKAKVKAYEKKLAKFKEEGGEFPIDPRREHFLMDDGTIIDTETGEVLRDSQGNTEPEADFEDAEQIAELPETPEEAKTPPKLKSSITGDEAQAIKEQSIADYATEQGRFPLPRATLNNFRGKTSDVAQAAKRDYQKVYDLLKEQDPEFSSKYPDMDSFWEKVKAYSVDDASRSFDSVDDIPEEHKQFNRAYAEAVLGMDPDGEITLYRNAVNNPANIKQAGTGYWSTDKEFAQDYQATKGNIAKSQQEGSFNGFYEGKFRPDQIGGMLGYSQTEDEFALSIGPDVADEEGRVTRVGPIQPPKLADWLDPKNKLDGEKMTGGSAFRHFALAGALDLKKVDNNPTGDGTLQDFFDANGITKEEWGAKYDELWGEGSYQESKDSGNNPSFQALKKMFKQDESDGKWYLDVSAVTPGIGDSLNPAFSGNGDPSTFKNDGYDSTLKFLSLVQDITGEEFMSVKKIDTPEAAPEVEEPAEIDVVEPVEVAEPEVPEEAAPVTVPTGYYDVTRSDYFPEGATEGQTSPDYTDDPTQLAQEYSTKDLTIALAQAVKGNEENPATGFGQLPFADGFEVVPAEALYKALDEQGEEADQILDDIYAGGNGEVVPDIAPETKASLGEELPEAAQGEKSDQEIPPLIDGLTEDEKSDFLETGDYKKYLPENKIYEDSDVPEGYSGIDNEPWTEIEGDLPEDAPEGFSLNPVDIANDYNNEDLIGELRRALEPGNPTPGYGILGMDTPEGEEYLANVPGEAIRDALQLQGVDTDELIDAIYQEGFDGQGENEPTPEEIQDALEGEDVEEGQESTDESEEEEATPAEEPTPSDEEGPPAPPADSGDTTGEPDGPVKVTAKAKDLKAGDVTTSDFFTIEEIFSDDESEAIKPGSVWAVGYYPGHSTQKTKLWNADINIDVFRNVTPPAKGDLPELSKPKPKEMDPEGKIFKDNELGVFVPKDAEARSKYLDLLDQYNKDLAQAKGLWTDAPDTETLQSFQSEDSTDPFTPASPVGITTVKATEVKPGDIAFKKEWGNDFFEYFIVESVEEVDGKAVVKGYYPGHISQDKEWNATTEITVMRGASGLPQPGTGSALERPKKDDSDYQAKRAAFNEAKKASADGFTPPLDPESAPAQEKKTPAKPKSPAYPAFSGDKLKEIATEANGDPLKFMELLKNEELMVLDFETAADGSFDSQTPIQVAWTKFKNGQGIATGNYWMNPEVPLGDWYKKAKPDEVLKDPSGAPISDEFLAKQAPADEEMERLLGKIGPETIVVAHNMPFDGGIIKRYAQKLAIDYKPAGEIDTLALSRSVINGGNGDHKLENVAKRYGITPDGGWHDAQTDSDTLYPILENLMAEMAKTKQGTDALNVESNQQKYEDALAEYNAAKEKKDTAETSLVTAQVVKDAFDGKENLPSVDEAIAAVPKDLPNSEEATTATTPEPAELSDGDTQIESVLGDTISNNWVDDNENTTDLGPVPVEDWLPGDFHQAPKDGWFEILEITPDPEDNKRVFVKRRLLANGKVYGEAKSWNKFQAYSIRRRNNVVEERAASAETPTPAAETTENWQGYDIKQDADGVYYADGISASDVQKLRNGQLTPPQLPFFAPMGGGNKPDQGDGYFFSANGKRFWGKFGAAGALIRRKNNKGEYEYFLAKRSVGLSQGGGKWGYPGGAHKDKMDAEENMGIITAINEFEEEVGGDLGVDTAVPMGKFFNPVAPDWNYTTHIFEVGPDEMKGLSPKDGENSEVGWFTAEQINKMAEDGQLQEDFAESATTILENLDDAPDTEGAVIPEAGDVNSSVLGTTFDTSKWKKVAGQAGSNQGAFYVDPATGQQYYVKKAKSELHAANEVLASALYEQAGLDVGRAYIGTDKSGNVVIVSPVVDGTDGTLGQIAPNQNILNEIKKGFAVDAWMNNYDVIGLDKDNIVVAGAKPYRIDAGGALLFRAQGISKADEMDTNVSEQITSLRDPDTNAQAASVFGDMTDAEIAESAKLVEGISESKIDELVDAAFAGDIPNVNSQSMADKLKENLKRRRKELIDLYSVDETPEAEVPEDTSVQKTVLEVPETENEKVSDLETQINEAIANGKNIKFVYNGKEVELSPEEVKTAKNGNVNVVGTLQNGKYYTYNLNKIEQSGAPSGTTGIFKEYSPDNSLTGAENTPLSDLGFDPEEEITIYRGVPKGVEDINSGDWVTSLEQLAKDYAGADGDVISKTVKAKDLLTDPSSGEGAYTEEMVYSPAAADVDFPEPTGEPVETEKPTEAPQDQKQKLIAKTEKVAEALFGNKDPEQVKKVLESFKEAEVEDPELVDSILNDLTNPAPTPTPKESPEEKIADDIVQALSPEDGDEDVPEAELKAIDPEELAKELANPTDPDLIWAKVKEDYEASTLDNGHIVVSSSMFGKVRMDVLVKRNSDNTFSVYHRITDTETGDTRVKEMKGRWHSYTALNSRVQTEIYKSKALPAKVVAGSKKEGAATLQPSLPPKQKEAYVSADGKTVVKVGMTVTDTKTGKKGVVTSLKDEYVVKSGGKTYIYTDAAKVKFEGAAKANWKISSFLMPEGSELPGTPDADGEQGEQPGDGGTPPTPPAPTAPAPATPEPVAASEEVVDLPGYEGPSTSGASTISEIETNAVAKNSDEYLSAFGAANYSDYKEFLKGMFVKDGEGGSGKNLVPGILVQNASPGSGDEDLTSYGVVNLTDADTGNIGVSWLDGPLKGESQVLKSNEVWSREKFISTKQADELGVELDQKLFNTSKEKALAKGKEYIEKQAKAKELAEKKAAQDKIEKEAKAAKQAKKDQFTVNGPGFSIQTANLPEADWSSSPAENVPSLKSALETVKGDNNLAASNGVTTLIDADKVEDLEVRIQKVTGKGNKEQIRLSLTLTDWAANGAVAGFIDDEAIAKSDGIDLDQWEKTEDGKLVRKKKWSTSYVAYSSGTTYSGKVGKGTFKLHRANKNAEKPDFFKHGNYSDSAVSFHNKAELFLPANATEADIQKALEDFGAIQNVRPATQQDVKGMVENKMIWLYGSETDGTKNFTGDLRKEQLDFIEKNYGFTADDVEISVDTNGYGRINYLIPEAAAKKIASDKDVKYFQHNWTGDSLPSGTDEKANYIYNLFASGGLFATANRWMNGVNSSGMSSKTDVKAAGGNYMFTSPVGGNSNGDSYNLRFTFSGEKLLRRMDWYKNNSDKYGQLGSDEENNVSKLGQSGEVMWKKNLSWADLSGIELNSAVRKKLIEMLTAPDNIVPDAENLLEVLKAGDK